MSTFSNVLLFRTCVSTAGSHNIKRYKRFGKKMSVVCLFVLFFYACTEQGFTPAMALLESPKNKSESCKTQLERLKR